MITSRSKCRPANRSFMTLNLLIVGPFLPNHYCNPLALAICTRAPLCHREPVIESCGCLFERNLVFPKVRPSFARVPSYHWLHAGSRHCLPSHPNRERARARLFRLLVRAELPSVEPALRFVTESRSSRAVAASSNETLCFRRFVQALRGSHLTIGSMLGPMVRWD